MTSLEQGAPDQLGDRWLADNLILVMALAGRAERIVSGARAGMLSLQAVSGIPVVIAREALGRLGVAHE